jgi:hypothetical protein
MPRPLVNELARIAAALAIGAWQACATASPQLAFDEVFDTRDAPRWLHYRVEYRDAAGPHRLEVWRDAGRQLKRVTDERIETYAVALENDMRLAIVDRQRGTLTVADRATLMRLGLFVDPFGQAHGVARPMGAYALEATGRTEEVSGRRCTVWRLTPAPSSAPSDVCWDRTAGVPLVIRDAEGVDQWRVIALDEAAIDEALFAPPKAGLAVNDLNRELAPDAD